MQKLNKGLELFWLFFTILVAIFCIYSFATDGVASGKYYLIFLILPLAMYLFRRYIRIRMENPDAKQSSKKGAKKK
ncbi:MAG: hypothetical protein ABF258_08910 [Flavobacteriales bacterium]